MVTASERTTGKGEMMALVAYKTHPSRKNQILADVDAQGNVTPAGWRPNPDYDPKAKSNASDDLDYEYVSDGAFLSVLIPVLIILGCLAYLAVQAKQ